MGTRKTVLLTAPFMPNVAYEHSDQIRMLGVVFVGMRKIVTPLSMPGQPPEIVVPDLQVVFAVPEHLVPMFMHSGVKVRDIDPKYLPKEATDGEHEAESDQGRPVLRLVGTDSETDEGEETETVD